MARCACPEPQGGSPVDRLLAAHLLRGILGVPDGGPGYFEFNFSPAGRLGGLPLRWLSRGHDAGERSAGAATCRLYRDAERLELSATVHLGALRRDRRGGACCGSPSPR